MCGLHLNPALLEGVREVLLHHFPFPTKKRTESVLPMHLDGLFVKYDF